MTDTPDPSRLLASAAFDNEVTADERAQVDASEALTAVVATYRTLRRDLAAVDVPSGARESGIAAALAVFDATMIDTSPTRTEPIDTEPIDTEPIDTEPIDTVTDSNVVSMQARRRREFRWLGGVAAAAIVAVLGIVVVGANNSNGKNVSSTAEPAPRVGVTSPGDKSSDQSGKQPNATSAADSASGGTQSGPGPVPVSGAASTAGSAAVAGPATASATAAVAPSAGSATAPGVGTDPWADAPSFDGAAALAAFAFAPGSPLSAVADSGARTPASAPSSAGSTANSTAGSTAVSSGGATAATTAFPASATTTSMRGAPATTAAATATTAAGTPTPPPQPVESILTERADAVCDTGGRPTIAAIYIGERVIIVRDDATSQLQILDPQTCAITSTIAVP